MMSNILIYSEKTALAAELLNAANAIAAGGTVNALAVNNEDMAKILTAKGVAVHVVDQDGLVLADCGAVAEILQKTATDLGCETILLPSDRRGKLLAGRLAQKMNAGCLTGVSSLKADGGKIICKRNVLGGAVIAEQVITTENQVIAVAPKSFAPAEDAAGGSRTELAASGTASGITFVGVQPKGGESVDISEADILLVVGQGVEDQAALATVEAIAAKLGGNVGCTKPVATDRKWFAEDRVVGISGKTCKPSLAILFGISGQVQFYAGIRDAGIIAAVNNDENAVIVNMADYVLNADVNEVLPTMKSIL